MASLLTTKMLTVKIYLFIFVVYSLGREKFWVKEEMGIVSYKMSTLFQSLGKEGKQTL